MKYCCKFCTYETCDKSNWCRHKKSKKHLKKSNVTSNNINNMTTNLLISAPKKSQTTTLNKKKDNIKIDVNIKNNIKNDIKDNIKDDIKNNNSDNNKYNREIKMAPPIIYLEDYEKFRNDDGNVIEIETRGSRNVESIYFKVKNVMEGFEMKSLYKTIIDERKSYTINIDYVYFLCFAIGESKKNKKNKIIKELYLTYTGILRALMISRSGKASKFINWATKTLFIVQMGTEKQKNKLTLKIKGVSYESIQELFSINARTMPCIYLTAFNKVGPLREIMKIGDNYNDDDIVYKFGLTKSFKERKNGHKNEYKELLDNIDMKLVCFSFIDPIYINDAESDLKSLLSKYKLNYENHNELVVISNDILKLVKIIYENLAGKYSGHTEEFNRKVNELTNIIREKEIEIERLENKYKFDVQNEKNIYNQLQLTSACALELQKERSALELQKEKYENELLRKEIELIKLRNALS